MIEGRVPVVPIAVDHPFMPGDMAGTQCVHLGCWGWIDDPRHLAHKRGLWARPVSERFRKPAGAGRRLIRQARHTR